MFTPEESPRAKTGALDVSVLKGRFSHLRLKWEEMPDLENLGVR